MRNDFLRRVVLKDVWMIDVLKFVHALKRISFKTHHNEGAKGLEQVLSPFGDPVIWSLNDALNYMLILIASEWERPLVEDVGNNANVPEFSTLHYGIVVLPLKLFNLLWREILSMIVLLFVISLLLLIH